MNAQFIQDGNAIDYTPTADTAAGTVVTLGALVGVTKVPIPAGTLGALALTGIYDLTKGSVAFSVGDAVYWSTTGAVKSGTVYFGVAVEAATASAATVRARLLPQSGGTTTTATNTTATNTTATETNATNANETAATPEAEE